MNRLDRAFRDIGGAKHRAQPHSDTPADSKPAERRVSRRVFKRLPVRMEDRELSTTNISQSGLQLQVSCPQSWLPSLQETWDRTAIAVQLE